jgi:hypothetical protein
MASRASRWHVGMALCWTIDWNCRLPVRRLEMEVGRTDVSTIKERKTPQPHAPHGRLRRDPSRRTPNSAGQWDARCSKHQRLGSIDLDVLTVGTESKPAPKVGEADSRRRSSNHALDLHGGDRRPDPTAIYRSTNVRHALHDIQCDAAVLIEPRTHFALAPIADTALSAEAERGELPLLRARQQESGRCRRKTFAALGRRWGMVARLSSTRVRPRQGFA